MPRVQLQLVKDLQLREALRKPPQPYQKPQLQWHLHKLDSVKAKVRDKAKVKDKAKVRDKAKVKDKAKVRDKANHLKRVTVIRVTMLVKVAQKAPKEMNEELADL